MQLLAAGVYTVNEVRAMRGLGPMGAAPAEVKPALATVEELEG